MIPRPPYKHLNYPAYVFRMTSLLEKLGIKQAIYVHKDEVRAFCNSMKYIAYDRPSDLL